MGTSNGEVVGLVTEGGLNYAVVKTVLDSSLEISANIASSGYNGMVQGGAALFADQMEGGYYNVMGLPVCRLAMILRSFGLPIWGVTV